MSIAEHPCVYAQVMDIDLSKESPCGHGTVTCFSLYGGVGNGSGSAEVCNFAADPDATPQDQLWVDTMLDGNQVELTTLLLWSAGCKANGVPYVALFSICVSYQAHHIF